MNFPTLYLTRHALATHRKDGYGDEILTASILPEGIPPIRRMAGYLQEVPFNQFFCSEIRRCQQTAQIISEIIDQDFSVEKRINEYYQETIADLTLRVQSFLSEQQTNPEQKLLLCTHGTVIAAIKNLILKDDFSAADELDYPETGELWIVHNGELQEKNFNFFSIDK